MTDKVAEAIETLRVELGLSTLTLWGPPGDDDAEIQAVFFAKDDDALMAAAIDYVTGGTPASEITAPRPWNTSSTPSIHLSQTLTWFQLSTPSSAQHALGDMNTSERSS